MKQLLLIVVISLFSFSVGNAQNSEITSKLTPISTNIAKFSKQFPVKKYSVFNRNRLKFKFITNIVSLPDNKKGIAVIIQAPYQELVFESIGGEQITKIRIYGRVTSDDKIMDGYFEEMLSETANIDDLIKGTDKDVIFRKVFELPQGKYQIGVIITDIMSEERGVKVVKFQIP